MINPCVHVQSVCVIGDQIEAPIRIQYQIIDDMFRLVTIDQILMRLNVSGNQMTDKWSVDQDMNAQQ